MLAAVAALLLIPLVAYADVPMASIAGPVTVPEGTTDINPGEAVYAVSLTGGSGSVAVVVKYSVKGTASSDDYEDPGNGTLTLDAGERAGTLQLMLFTTR